jgi:hypothetical protein
MDPTTTDTINGGGAYPPRLTFFEHVFNGTEQGRAEVLNVAQYGVMAFLPIAALNLSVNYLSPEVDADKGSPVLLLEILLQIVLMFTGMVLIHRLCTFFSTWSGYRYEHLNMSSTILAFLVLVLSQPTKIGLKTRILTDRAIELWEGHATTGGKHRAVSRDHEIGSFIPPASSHPPASSSSSSRDQDFSPVPASSLLGFR